MNKNKILLADDDATLRRILKDQLTSYGYAIDEAEDGAEAIEKLQNGQYDLLLLDMKMPIVSGMDVLKFISKKHLGCPVIVLTVMPGLAVESLRYGAHDSVTKPFAMGELRFSIETALGKAKPLC